MSHIHPNPTLAMPGGRKMETILVCVEGTCGTCVRCIYLQGSRTLSQQATAAEMVNHLADQSLKEHQALIIILKAALSSINNNLTHDEEGNSRKALQELVEMTPEDAYRILESGAEQAQAAGLADPPSQGRPTTPEEAANFDAMAHYMDSTEEALAAGAEVTDGGH